MDMKFVFVLGRLFMTGHDRCHCGCHGITGVIIGDIVDVIAVVITDATISLSMAVSLLVRGLTYAIVTTSYTKSRNYIGPTHYISIYNN